MFQRFKNVIERGITDEQARQNAPSEQAEKPTIPQSHSAEQIASTMSESAPDKDPAIFEAALTEKESEPNIIMFDSDEHSEKVTSSDQTARAASPASSTPVDLPADVQTRLRKLDKLEKTYPELLRSYRIAHGRIASIEPFERALKENTPLASIRDAAAFVEYLNQLTLKGDMFRDELKRVSAEKDAFEKKADESQKELAAVREELASVKAEKSLDPGSGDNAADKRPESLLDRSDCEDEGGRAEASNSTIAASSMELQNLQAEVAAKAGEIDRCNAELFNLRHELALAKEHTSGLDKELENLTRELIEERESAAAEEAKYEENMRIRDEENLGLVKRMQIGQSIMMQLNEENKIDRRDAALVLAERESKLKASYATNANLIAKIGDVKNTLNMLHTIMGALSTDTCTMTREEVRREIEKLDKQLEAAFPAPAASISEVQESAAKKNKKKKKKNKGGASTSAGTAAAGTTSVEPAAAAAAAAAAAPAAAAPAAAAPAAAPAASTAPIESAAAGTAPVEPAIAGTLPMGNTAVPVAPMSEAGSSEAVTEHASLSTEELPDEELPDEELWDEELSDRELPDIELPAPASESPVTETSRLKDETAGKEKEIGQPAARWPREEELVQEIILLREDLIKIGQAHTAAKEQIKQLECEAAMAKRIADLEKVRNEKLEKTTKGVISELQKVRDSERTEAQRMRDELSQMEKAMASSASAAKDAADNLQGEHDALEREYDNLKSQTAALRSDLKVAEQLAQTRFKELTKARETLNSILPELKTLRQDSNVYKATKKELDAVREELSSKTNELDALETYVKALKTDLARFQHMAVDREAEAKTLRDNVTAMAARLDNEKRALAGDLQRVEAEKTELVSKEEKTSRELQRAQEEVAQLRPHVRQLEDEMGRLAKEQTLLRKEAELKAGQYESAQALLSSMREQAAELGVRLRESQASSEALEEELAEARRMLGERTRETETMRHLLADAETRAKAQMCEAKDQLDAAVEEQNRLQAEGAALAKKKARETEELRGKLHDLEREMHALVRTKEKEWLAQREELEAREQRAATEAGEVRTAVGSLRATLEAVEGKAREAEAQKAELRRALDDYRIRYDRLARDLKAAQTKLSLSTSTPSSPSTAAAGGRSSLSGGGGSSSNNSNNSNTNTNGSVHGSVESARPSAQGAPGPNADVMYLKTIMLQFLEQKDNKLRAQLVPVLGSLLRFDKSDEQKWLAVVQNLGTR